MARRALISLSDKTGVVEFAQSLVSKGFEIISTGGTAKLLTDSGVSVIPVDAVTGFPECLDGRLKTLHPAVHGGILARRDLETHRAQLLEQEIQEIDLVAVNLYPFKQTVLRSDATMHDVIENIDIGGPAMVRSAAKNHASVYIVTDHKDYPLVLEALDSEEATQGALRYRLAAKAFAHTAAYDAMIAQFLIENSAEPVVTDQVTFTYEREQSLRYGENAHQQADYYVEPFSEKGRYRQLWGKELSFNNINDLSAAVRIVSEFERPAVVAVKHASPCGAAIGYDVFDAYSKAYATDPLSIFGGIVAFNREVDVLTARKLAEIFLEVIFAPSFEPEALDVLRAKKNIRLLVPSERASATANPNYRLPAEASITKTIGGLLVQSEDEMESRTDYRVVTDRIPTDREIEDLEFAMKICKGAKSNAIVLAFNQQCVGIGQGQVSRVFAAENAVDRAALSVKGTVLASDAFFPFEDALEYAIRAGITAVIQPGGSVADDKIIELCNQHGVAMIFTGRRHFKHGY
ncbi:MAG: bifunctional phosphoribosylaminoimidazolecarboxamide formyltransferase/IMP cyclohydrolase [Bacillota bacterium]|nr:bifunctional phosphoribosylaminoimidazolecarboxamide formyltransferase/IMP cyclohydrolase [Bacillota bacterium]